MRFKKFIENMWGTIPSPNPPSQPYWLKGSSSAIPSSAPMPNQPPPQQKKMMKKKMKKD